MNDAPRLVIGTAGHIDHGKSRLVHALTGTDPDRLPEEKARGMTIDLGFAHSRIDDCDLWFVDVPGHERFIRNMVAGASGIDLALLVVAADDSVMPQTREHAEVLSLLGLDRCVVALTKMDLVDDDWAEAVEEEVRELLDSLGIRVERFVRTSAETGRGIDELRQVLADLARRSAADADGYAWFRLPIDRAFSIAGRGTVVTGSVAHGRVCAEDELDLWPAGRRVRVRHLQTHHEGTEAAAGRMRLALNLAGVALDEVRRGCELATPGYLEPTRLMDVWIAALRMPGKILRRELRLRLHIATSEVLARLRLLDSPDAPRVDGVWGQLLLAEPVVAAWGQRFILRDESGSRTLGGGTVVRPVARRWNRRHPADPAVLEILRSGPAKARLDACVAAYAWDPCPDEQLATRAGIGALETLRAVRRQLGVEGRIRRLRIASTEVYVHASHLDALAERLCERLRVFLGENPRLPGLSRNEWPAWMPRNCPARLRPVVADWLIEHKRVALADGYVVPPGHAAAMSPEDQRLFDAICAQFEEAGFQPPAPGALACLTPKNARRVRELVDLAVARGRLVRVSAEVYLHARRWDELVEKVTAEIRARGGLTVAEIRTLLGSSRKYVVPIVEALDAAGITRRVGDRRVLAGTTR